MQKAGGLLVELLGFSSLLTSQTPTYTFMLILGCSEALTTMIHWVSEILMVLYLEDQWRGDFVRVFHGDHLLMGWDGMDAGRRSVELGQHLFPKFCAAMPDVHIAAGGLPRKRSTQGHL